MKHMVWRIILTLKSTSLAECIVEIKNSTTENNIRSINTIDFDMRLFIEI